MAASRGSDESTRELRLRRIFIAIAFAASGAIAISFVVVLNPYVRTAVVRFLRIHPGYERYSLIDTPAETYSGADRTVIVFVRLDCHACETARPFLRQLVGDIASRPWEELTMVAVAGGESAQDLRQEYGLAPALRVFELDEKAVAQLKLAVVPTIALVDRRGRVLYSYEGAPRKADEEAIKAVLLSR